MSRLYLTAFELQLAPPESTFDFMEEVQDLLLSLPEIMVFDETSAFLELVDIQENISLFRIRYHLASIVECICSKLE